MKEITKDEISKILELHKKWLFSIDGGERANLRSADLSFADLSYADLSFADLRFADLSSADLRYANLSSANLRSADLSSADLSYADLSSADLSSADLSSANLSSANLRYADLSSADLRYANLRSADLRYANLRSADLSSAKTDKRYFQAACIGSRKDMTTYCFDDDVIFCGCFKGTLKEFEDKVLKKYPDAENIHHREYVGLINYIRGIK